MKCCLSKPALTQLQERSGNNSQEGKKENQIIPGKGFNSVINFPELLQIGLK